MPSSTSASRSSTTRSPTSVAERARPRHPLDCGDDLDPTAGHRLRARRRNRRRDRRRSRSARHPERRLTRPRRPRPRRARPPGPGEHVVVGNPSRSQAGRTRRSSARAHTCRMRTVSTELEAPVDLVLLPVTFGLRSGTMRLADGRLTYTRAWRRRVVFDAPLHEFHSFARSSMGTGDRAGAAGRPRRPAATVAAPVRVGDARVRHGRDAGPHRDHHRCRARGS